MIIPNIFPVTCHTDHVGPGSLFVAIPGFKHDGCTYIEHAIRAGATRIIVPEYTQLEHISGIDIERSSNPRKTLAQLSAQALGYPAQKLKIIGITGTKGKSTTTYLIEHILATAGHKTARITGITNKILDREEQSTLTSPESDYLQMFFAECVKHNVEYVIMEVSSHALTLHRTYGIDFEAIGFTNLYPDHLDFHESMNEYFEAKCKIFTQLKASGTAVINRGNEWGARAYEGFHAHHTIKALNLDINSNTLDGLTITCNNHKFSCPSLFGTFNAHNLAMAITITQGLNIDNSVIQHALNSFTGVPGRLARCTLKNGAKAFVDFAHNPDAMRAVLNVLRPMTPHLIVVFGCGGNKPKDRRFGMGSVAAELADEIVLTNDNPRFEEPEAIIADIMSAMSPASILHVTTILDRKEAIEHALQKAQPSSIVAVLGKGHETSMIVNGKSFHFDDMEIISTL